ncbi:unnamed protein product [Kuraishia capsulata CBS 1993]|uniref:Crh-like protein n=1 Tax=Kuraishia capsulata CBS 1993 TaxID=1382522 RepID=W6MGC4_9ASCO|nr:uncharacterized protein KUCA_T00001081001 [Kuraishia capsulata CBS 1993]CDK25114.1 unnamed protein product [Kuraishia capsulata CBS 1993]
MKHTSLFLLTAFFFSIARATYYCNSSSTCPDDYPCCSQYGECGTGNYCLGGCDPRFSYNISSCMAMPVCRDIDTNFTSLDILEDSSYYLGNSSESDWIYSGYLLEYEDSLVLAMPNQSTGTVVSSTFYVWYGKVSARFRSSRTAGVVSSFILFSNAQDEIDVEFVGSELKQTQTNFYFEGILNYTNGLYLNTSNTFSEWHDYEVDWTEDEITWYIDGEEKRTLRKEDTYNDTSDTYMFPQTPSRIQFSLWAGGDSSNAAGTIEWAGGEIDWDAEDLTDPGYFYSMLQSISVECYDPPSYTNQKGSKAYVYNSSSEFLSENIEITNDRTYLYSYEGSGLDPDAGKVSSSSTSKSSSKTKSKTTSYKKTTVTSSGKTEVLSTAVTSTIVDDGNFYQSAEGTGSTSQTDGASSKNEATPMQNSLLGLTSLFLGILMII